MERKPTTKHVHGINLFFFLLLSLFHLFTNFLLHKCHRKKSTFCRQVKVTQNENKYLKKISAKMSKFKWNVFFLPQSYFDIRQNGNSINSTQIPKKCFKWKTFFFMFDNKLFINVSINPLNKKIHIINLPFKLNSPCKKRFMNFLNL